jgi:chromate reductase
MADKALNVITICGSLRKGSYNRMVMNLLPGWAPANLKISEAPPFSEFPLYNADVQNSSGFPASVQTLADAIRAADGVIFANKPVMIISAAAGVLGGGRMQYDLRRCMIFLDALTMNKPEVFIGGAMQKFDEKSGQLKDEQAVGFIKQQLATFAKFIEQHGGKS